MKSRLGLFLSLLFLPILAYPQDWKLKKNEQGIQVYTKTVEGSNLDAFKAIAVLESSPDLILEKLRDADHFEDWMPNCVSSKLEKRDGALQYHYVETKTPFPLDNRDSYYLFDYELSEKKSLIKVKGLPKYGPSRKGIVRMPSIEGFWLLEVLGPQKTRVSYQLQADPGGNIPAWVANQGSIDLPFNTLRNLKAQLSKK